MRDERVIAAWVSIGSNALLVISKLAAGFLVGSVSIVSEAIHSANDLLASCIALFAVKTSNKPPDKEHPFGHAKIENISGTIEALLIFLAALLIIKEAVNRLFHGTEIQTLGWGLGVMGFSALLNLGVSAYLMHVAQKTASIALEADAMHLRTDVYTSAGVFLGLLLIKLTDFTIIDPIVAILVALLILKTAYDLTRKAFMPLMDTALSDQEIDSIKVVMERYSSEYVSYHNLRTRRAGRECHVDLHLVARPEMSIKEVHDLCDRIEEGIMDLVPFSHVLIHAEPDEGEVGV